MKKNPDVCVEPGFQTAKEDLARLVEMLHLARQEVNRSGNQGCAELDEAIAIAEQVQMSILNQRKNKALSWDKICWVLEYLLKVAKLFCASTNCFNPRKPGDDYWVRHKATTPMRRLVSIRSVERAWSYSKLSVSSRNGQETTQYRVAPGDRR
jgi:hypothetical protein